MRAVVQARLDERAQRALERLARQHGWSRSRVVREALLLLEQNSTAQAPRRIVGLGQFASGIPDLGSNPDHLRDFGR